jgi:hypothetical protein
MDSGLRKTRSSQAAKRNIFEELRGEIGERQLILLLPKTNQMKRGERGVEFRESFLRALDILRV